MAETKFMGGAYDCWKCHAQDSMREVYGRAPSESRYVRDHEPVEMPTPAQVVGWKCWRCGNQISNSPYG